jgi:hypothetical protein
MEKLRVIIAHDSVSIGLCLTGGPACRCSRRTRATGGGRSRVRHPGEFDVTDAWDVGGSTEQLFGKISLLEGDNDRVWAFRIAIDALIVTDSL